MGNTFSGLLSYIQKQFPNRLCFLDKDWSYGDVLRLIRLREKEIASIGLKKGEVVGILGENSPEWCISFLAITGSGMRALLLDYHLPAKILTAMISNVGCKLLYADEALFSSYGVVTVSMNKFKDISCILPDRAISPAEIAVLGYTSGTTGKAKIVALTHRNLLHTAKVFYIEHLNVNYDDRILSILPLYHIYGLITGFLGPFISGASIAFQRSLKVKEIFTSLTKNKITILAAVPRIWILLLDGAFKYIRSSSRNTSLSLFFILDNARFWRKSLLFKKGLSRFFLPMRRLFGLQLRYLITGGAAMSSRFFHYYQDIGFNFLEGYGLSETSATFCGSDIKKQKPGCVGKPFRGNMLEIRNADYVGRGEIWLKGESVMSGYYNNQEATKDAFDINGWFNSGDIGYLDQDGDLHITGRKKNVVVLSSGKTVYPEELEQYYSISPIISEIAVLGLKIGEQEQICAVVVPVKETDHIFIKKEFRKLNKGLPTYRTVTKFFISAQPLPRFPSQKLNIPEILDKLEKGFYG